MSLFITTKTSDGDEKLEIDAKELALRLRSLVDGCNIEIIRLAISSILDEIEDVVG